jgi:WD40 repeat protein
MLSSASADGIIKLWDPSTGQELRTVSAHTDQAGTPASPGPEVGYIRAIAFSPDGKTLASSGSEGSVRLWDPMTGRQRQTIWHGQSAGAICSPDLGHFITWHRGRDPAEGTAVVWDTAAGRQVAVLPSAGKWTAAFSPDGTTLLIGHANGTVAVWDTPRGGFVSAGR